MNKERAELISQARKADAMIRKIDRLRITADEQTRKALDEIIVAGLDAYAVTKAGL